MPQSVYPMSPFQAPTVSLSFTNIRTEEQGSQNHGHRIAAHLTGSRNKKSSLATSNSSSRRGVGQKINTWEPSRKDHSFLYNVELKNGELIIPRTLVLCLPFTIGTEEQGSQNHGHRIAAHLTGSRNKKSSLATSNSSSRRGVGQKINTWEPSRKDHSFLYNVELKNGELIIPRTGFYYIYSQTYFRFSEPENEDSESDPLALSRNPKQMVQYVYKLTTYPEPILLMKSARTSCWSKKAEYGLYSIYQGGVFQLKRDDKIFVSVSNEDIVDMDKEASFFGAFLIS
ncbi:hypothetical protein KIL84_015115 [Mauremys mutica]|uniref:Tumor necrosis factor ligand superfamily member 10 n=1 Tax=Mauremys mutica TaxID=74926 RepID=A0A9D3WPN3_9SAUR|nr:hypothetical protein KIL84_015115 [Mauremys mutica]